MKFFVTTNQPLDYVTANGRRVGIAEAATGTDYADIGAFCAAHGLTPYAAFVDKAAQRTALQAQYNAALAAGLTVGDYVLAAEPADQTAWKDGAIALLNAEALAEDKEAFASAMVSTVFGRQIRDRAGALHDVTVTEYRQLFAGLAQQIGTLQGELAANLEAVG